MPARDDSDDTPSLSWGPGFVRGFELGTSRFADALRRRLLRDFLGAGWTVHDIELLIAQVAQDADSVRPSR